MSCRLSWSGPAARPGGAAGAALAPCVGPRLRPLVVGYVRLQASDTPGVADLLIAEMRAFALRCGLAGRHIHRTTRCVLPRGAVFSVLVEALRRPHIHAVVIPSPGQLCRFGGMYRARCTLIETETGAKMLVTSDRPRSAR